MKISLRDKLIIYLLPFAPLLMYMGWSIIGGPEEATKWAFRGWTYDTWFIWSAFVWQWLIEFLRKLVRRDSSSIFDLLNQIVPYGGYKYSMIFGTIFMWIHIDISGVLRKEGSLLIDQIPLQGTLAFLVGVFGAPFLYRCFESFLTLSLTDFPKLADEK